MKVFLDTNVLVDYLNKREPFFEDAASIIGICLSGQAKGVLSALSVVNAAYIMRKAYTKNSLMTKMEWLATAFEISPINRQTMPSPPVPPTSRMPCNASLPYNPDQTSSSPVTSPASTVLSSR